MAAPDAIFAGIMPAIIKNEKSDLPVQSFRQKYSGSHLTQITCISLAVPSHTEGRFAIVTDVGQGMRWTRVALSTRALVADGEVVWS